MSLQSHSGNPEEAEVRQALSQHKRIAVVGLSDKPHRASYGVAQYLKNHGYEIFPVNPQAEEVMGLRSYPDLASVPGPVDIVDVFRRSEFTPAIAREAVAIGARMLWLQLGLINEEAAEIARQANMMVVQDACLKVEHSRLLA